jgi:asparagine synthase (glutamine-hydrolysing)
MCGIAGIWFNKPHENPMFEIKSMTDAIIHRGPDGEGQWISDNHQIALGHRRLSIIDLTIGGAQPMHFQEKYTITFNGEIYNYIELKHQLSNKGYSFRSDSDTEVILAAYDHWGVNCLQHFDGMFSFGLYDKIQNILFCARDRFGEKPFYYSFLNGSLYFGSEMKTLWSVKVPKDPNFSMLYNFLANDLVENPNNQLETFYKGINKLKSAHYFVYKGDETVDQINYWKLDIEQKNDSDFKESSNKLMELLETSVKRRLRSDVPVGTSLSGGLDSSTIVGIVSNTKKNNHTFSARFPGFSKDEGKYIDIVSSLFETNHHNIVVNEDELLPELDKLIYHQEEPFQTGSIFAQYCVYREARRNNVIVMLDGQGADEMLGGYDKDFKFYLRELVKSKGDSEKFIRQIQENHNFSLRLDVRERMNVLAPKLLKGIVNIKRSFFPNTPYGINRDFFESNSPKKSPFHEFGDLKSMLHHELTNQGLEKLLRFADRNSMAHSLEVRLPFLYHELVEFIFSLKSEQFLHEGWSKAILRDGVKNLLPIEINYRKDKIGFEAPHDKWSKSNKMKDLFLSAQDHLISNNIITSDYQNSWKTIIASKFLSSR